MRTAEQNKNLQDLLQTVIDAPKLANFKYDAGDCYCVVGHMAKSVGVLGQITQYNEESFECLDDKITSVLMNHYGLDVAQIQKLQHANDYNSFFIEKGNKEAVLEKLQEYMGE